MYEFDARVRYSEVNAECELKLSSLVNYLQDCTIFHSQDLGIGVEYLAERHQAWVLNYWQIDIIRRPRLGERITIGTIPYSIRGAFGFRNIYIKNSTTGEMLVKANSVWTYIDLINVMPVKAEQSMIDAYACSEKMDMEYTDRKIKLSGEYRECEPIAVSAKMIDTNNHVNNEQYLELALSVLGRDVKPKRMRIEYKKSAHLGDVLIPRIYEGDGVGVEFIIQGDDEPCVKCQFT